MSLSSRKRNILFFLIILLVFIGAAFIFYLFIFIVPSIKGFDGDSMPTVPATFAKDFHAGVLEGAKFFLTILVGVFVASLTFSEKIVDLKTASPWSKTLLVFCWLLLLFSIVSDGVGIVFWETWFGNEMIAHDQNNMGIFGLGFICFAIAGISFGFALTSMLAAGIISFLGQIKFFAETVVKNETMLETETILEKKQKV